MDNYHFIKQASREDLITVINLLINDGSQLVADELWEATHVVDHGENREEVSKWLDLDTLSRKLHPENKGK